MFGLEDGYPRRCFENIKRRIEEQFKTPICVLSNFLGAADGGFDGAVGFVGGDEDVVGVVLAEAVELG